MVNLFLVVIATQFSETKRRETEKIAEERKRYKSSTTLASNRTDTDGCYGQLLKYVIYLCNRAHKRLKEFYKEYKKKQHEKNKNLESDGLADITLNMFGNHIRCRPCYHFTAAMERSDVPVASPEPSDIDSVSYMGLSRHLQTSPRFFRRHDQSSPVIVISGGQDETSFNASSQTRSFNCLQNGGFKVRQ